MHTLKLKKLDKRNIYVSSYTSFPELVLLSRFLEDFVDDHGIKFIKKMIEDPFSHGVAGNNSAVNKLKDGKISISDLYAADHDDSSVDLEVDVLLSIMECFDKASETLPKGIIITFDDNLRNPHVEIVQ